MFGKVYWGVFSILFAVGLWKIYGSYSSRAAEEVANSKTYRYPCGVPFRCDGIEVQQSVDTFSQVIAPTVCIGVLMLAVATLVYRLLTMPADPADNNAKK